MPNWSVKTIAAQILLYALIINADVQRDSQLIQKLEHVTVSHLTYLLLTNPFHHKYILGCYMFVMLRKARSHLLCMRSSPSLYEKVLLPIQLKNSEKTFIHCIAGHSEQLRHCLKLFTYNVGFYELLPPCTCYSVEGQLLVVIH